MTDRGGAPASGALVLGDDYKALGVVRSLGRQGIPVWVVEDDHRLAGLSRYTRRRLRPMPEGEAERVAYLLRLAEAHGLDGWALIPAGDETAALLARNHEVLGRRYVVTVPPWEVLRWAYDKRLTYRLAAELGIDHPRTHYPRSRSEVVAFEGPFPVILKPAIRPELNPFTMSKAWRVEDRAALITRYDEARACTDPSVIMIQDVIPGGGASQLSYAALCRDGQPLASLVARRTRQWPMDFGRASTYVETVDAPEVESTARRVLAALHFDGIVEVEFKRDPRDGRLLLLDINPRVWGWHSIGGRAGVDFVHLLWRSARGESVPEARGRPGVRWVRGLTDLPMAIGEIRAGRLSLLAYLASLRGPTEFAVIAADDPVPALLEVPVSAYLAWRRRGSSAGAHAARGATDAPPPGLPLGGHHRP